MPTPPVEPVPVESTPVEAALEAADPTSAEDLRMGGVATLAYSTSSQHADGSGLTLGGSRYGSPIAGFWGLSADATYWPSDFDFGRLGIDAHVGGRLELWNVRDRRAVVLPGEVAAGVVVRRGEGDVTFGWGAGLRVVTLPVVAYSDVSLADAEPNLAPLFGAYASGVAWWEPADGFLAGGLARADARVTLGTVMGAHVGVLADKPVDGLPVLLRAGLATDLDVGFRLGGDPARVLRGSITASVGVAKAL